MRNTYVLGCNRVDIPLSTHGTVDVSLLFDHIKSVAGPWRSALRCQEGHEENRPDDTSKVIPVTGYSFDALRDYTSRIGLVKMIMLVLVILNLGWEKRPSRQQQS